MLCRQMNERTSEWVNESVCVCGWLEWVREWKSVMRKSARYEAYTATAVHLRNDFESFGIATNQKLRKLFAFFVVLYFLSLTLFHFSALSLRIFIVTLLYVVCVCVMYNIHRISNFTRCNVSMKDMTYLVTSIAHRGRCCSYVAGKIKYHERIQMKFASNSIRRPPAQNKEIYAWIYSPKSVCLLIETNHFRRIRTTRLWNI